MADPIVSTLNPAQNGGGTVYGDLQEFDAVTCFTNNVSFCSGAAANVISFPASGSVSTAVTVPLGGQTITLGSNAWCTANMAGQPLYIVGITPPGTKLNGCLSSNRIAIDKGSLAVASGATFTVQYGVNFQSVCPAFPSAVGVTGCVGSTIINPNWNNSFSGGAIMTIATVNSPTNVTVSANTTSIVPNNSGHWYVGRDDSAPVNAACAYAYANGQTLDVPVAHLTVALSRLCYGIPLRGAGRLATAGDSLTPSATVFPEPVVVPWNAGPPSPPTKELIARVHLPNTAAAGITPSFAMAYDSLETGEPNILNDTDVYPALMMAEFQKQNPGISPVEWLCGIGGATMTSFDANPIGINGACITTTGSPTLSQIAANAAPNLLVIGGGNNDSTGLSTSAMVDVWVKATLPNANGGVFANPVDVITTTHHNYSRFTPNGGANTPIETGGALAAGYIESFAHVMGLGAIDGWREGAKHVWGYDPEGMKFVRAYDIPYGSTAITLGFQYPRQVTGFAATFTKAGQTGNTFWANFTGNGGVTDSRGPMIAFQLSEPGGVSGKNILWLFQVGSNQIGVQCDINNLLPGLGCDNPATGKPPVVPSLMGTITVSAANPAVVSSSVPFGFPCTPGMTVAVPQAGAAHSPGGSIVGPYVEPDIDVVTICTDSQHMTLTNAAVTPGTYTNSFVMSGNPVINTGITDFGTSGNELFHVEYKADNLLIWWNSPQEPALISHVVRGFAPGEFAMFSGGNFPTLNIAGDIATGETTFQTPRPIPNVADFLDAGVNGPPTQPPPTNLGYIGSESGDGVNHNTSGFGERVLRAVTAAADWSVPPGAGIFPVTSGAAATVPSCQDGTVAVNDTTAPTITLPVNCQGRTQMVFVDQGGNAGSHTITIAAPTGLTLNGTKTITAPYGRRTVIWDSTNTATVQ